LADRYGVESWREAVRARAGFTLGPCGVVRLPVSKSDRSTTRVAPRPTGLAGEQWGRPGAHAGSNGCGREGVDAQFPRLLGAVLAEAPRLDPFQAADRRSAVRPACPR